MQDSRGREGCRKRGAKCERHRQAVHAGSVTGLGLHIEAHEQRAALQGFMQFTCKGECAFTLEGPQVGQESS